MFISPTLKVKARKPHVCTYCGEAIEKGDVYLYWTNYDGAWVANRLHLECREALMEDYDIHGGEYMPYENVRPRKDQA